MADMGGGANRIELESQILCSALRQSWSESDSHGVVNAARELYQLFPDLLPPPKQQAKFEPPKNLYEQLHLGCDVPPSRVLSGYFRYSKKFLRENKDKIVERQQDYFQVLNSGFILRKPRLRLSHDMIVVRGWLIDSKLIPDDGTLELIQAAEVEAPKPTFMVKTQPIATQLPMLVELLKTAQIIGPAEVQALSNQMAMAPEIPIAELILNAGYVTDQEMLSLQLAETLLAQGKITVGQFCVAMYDERTTGVRMAESLQVRGWLETEVRQYGEQPQKT